MTAVLASLAGTQPNAVSNINTDPTRATQKTEAVMHTPQYYRHRANKATEIQINALGTLGKHGLYIKG